MSKVFVVQNVCWRNPRNGLWEPKHDLTPAESFGKIEYILESDTNPYNSSHVVAEMMTALTDFCDDDFLLLIGNPALIGVAMSTAAGYNDGRVRVLQWDRKNRYIPVSFDLPLFR